jgi:hypothetical protein
MTPVGHAILNQAQRAGCAGAFLDRNPGTQLDNGRVRPADGPVQKPLRIEERVRFTQKSLLDILDGKLGCPRTIRVATHAVDRNQQDGVISDNDFDAILIFLSITQETDFCYFTHHAVT